MRRWLVVLGSLGLTLPGSRAAADSLHVAAAANFVYALDALKLAFERSSPGTKVTTTTGASGTLFAQITHGAPFDVFLSADLDYPRRVVTDKLGDAATLRTFATGRLVVWTLRPDVDLADLRSAITSPATKKIALAQPKTAPYGRAAQAALEHAGVWSIAEGKRVLGESITQTAQFVETGNADVGIVALSLVLSPRLANRGRWKEIPAEFHASVSLDHGVVLTRRGSANPSARRFLDFLESEPAKQILREFGYGVK